MNKGYMLFEAILSIAIIGVILTLFRPVLNIDIYLKRHQFAHEFYACQINSINKRKKCVIPSVRSVHFNEFGNVNHGQTLNENFAKVIIQLGFGRFRYE